MLLKLWSVCGWKKDQHLFKQAIKINYLYKTVDTAVSEYYRIFFINVTRFKKKLDVGPYREVHLKLL